MHKLRMAGTILAIVLLYNGCMKSCNGNGDNGPTPPQPLTPSIGWGIGDPFLFIWHGTITGKANKILSALEQHQLKNTTIRVMLSHKYKDKSGKWWGQKWCPYNTFDDPTSGFNQPFFDKLRWFVQQCNKKGVTVCLQMIDGNWIHLDPFTKHYGTIPNAYGGNIRAQQKAYFNKVLATVDDLAVYYEVTNERWFGATGEVLTDEVMEGQEVLLMLTNVTGAVAYPSKSWVQSSLNYLKTKTTRKVGVWTEYSSVTGESFVVVHAGWDTAPAGRVCNEERVGNKWGGDGPVTGYKTCVQICHERKVILIFAFWEWVLFDGEFAPRQLAAMQWAKGKGWY